MADRQVDRGLRGGRRGLTPAPDVAIIGGGIVGCAAAAFLAEAGASVELYERDDVASAASGRNSGSVQHPFDPVMASLHTETLSIYRGLEGFELAREPAGVLMLSSQRAGMVEAAAEIGRELPELRPSVLEGGELTWVEPLLAGDLVACRLETGYPVRPAGATRAFARRAHERGAVFHEHRQAWPWSGGGRARGVISGDLRRPAGSVLVAAGPWTPELVDTTRVWRPIGAVWGVVVEVELPQAPRHVLEEGSVGAVHSGEPGSLFSLVAADGAASLGSTFLAEQPDPDSWIERLRSAGRRFVPALADAPVVGARACARPQSLDGRPLVGEVGGVEGLWAAAGHGPWGISTGPATARIAADALLGRGEVPSELSTARLAT